MIQLITKDKVVSPQVKENITAALAAIEQANPSIDWEQFKAYLVIRKFYRWPWLKIFPYHRVFLDLVDKSLKTEINIPAGTMFGEQAWKKKGLGGRPMWCFRCLNMVPKRRWWLWGKIEIKMKGE